MDMNLLIYVLFLSICDSVQNYEENTTERTNATENETTFTTIEVKTNESTWSKMDVSQKSILFFGIVAFMLYSSLYLHCFDLLKLWRKESSKEEKANKYALGSSKTALSEIKTSNLDREEIQPIRSNSVKLSGDSNPEKTPMVSTTEKTNKSISRERETMSTGDNKLSQSPKEEMLVEQSKQKKFNSTPDQRKSKTRYQRNSPHPHTVIKEMRSNSVKLSGDSNPEKTPMLSTTEKTNKSISRERETMSTGDNKLCQSPKEEMLVEQSKQKKFNSTPDQRKSKTRYQRNSPHPHTVIKEMRSNSVKLSGDSNPEKTPMLSTTEKTNKSISRERESMPTGDNKLSQSPKEEMLVEQSKQKKFNSTPDQRKSKTRYQRNSPHSHRVIKEIYSSYLSRIIKTPGSNTLDNQCKQNVTSSACNSLDHFFSCTLQNMMKTSQYTDLHTGETHKCPRHPLSNSCQCHKEICLVCMTSEYVINEDFEANYKLSPFSKKMSFSRSFDRIKSQDCIIYDKMSSSDEVKIENDNNDDDSDKEITIFFNIDYEKGILENTEN